VIFNHTPEIINIPLKCLNIYTKLLIILVFKEKILYFIIFNLIIYFYSIL